MSIFKRKKEEIISSELIAENKDYRIYKCYNRDTLEHIGYLLFNIQDRTPELFRGTLQDFGEYLVRKYYNAIKSLEVYGDIIKFNT